MFRCIVINTSSVAVATIFLILSKYECERVAIQDIWNERSECYEDTQWTQVESTAQ